jgi:hypothetical protein
MKMGIFNFKLKSPKKQKKKVKEKKYVPRNFVFCIGGSLGGMAVGGPENIKDTKWLTNELEKLKSMRMDSAYYNPIGIVYTIDKENTEELLKSEQEQISTSEKEKKQNGSGA